MDDKEVLEWDELGLCKETLDLIGKAGYRQPTAIQQETIPIVLDGRDLIASARTGSGKTAAFCLPMIERLRGRRGMYGLILCPTREIALQTHETIGIFGVPLGVTSAVVIGGVDISYDEKALRANPQILVGTPGRICDHLQRGNLWLEYIETVVLDEADRMLDMGFAKEVSRIVGELSQKRQTLLFSATFAAPVEKLSRQITHRPVRIAIGSPATAPTSIRQELYWVNERSKRRALLRIIEREPGSVLVFTRTKDDAMHLWHWVHAAGVHDSTYISSNRLQAHREQALQGFKDGTFRVLIATDVAGRGIHVENIGCVLNYDLPEEPEDYIHRIGRTGRKDATGKAISLVTSRDQGMVRRIEKALRVRIPERFASDYRPEREREPSRESSRGGRRRPSRSPRESSSGSRSSSSARSRRPSRPRRGKSH